MTNIFWYRKEIKTKEKVENWTPESGTLPEKEVVVVYWDCFNIDKVVRGHWTKEDEFTVFMDDGHEQADDVQKPKYNAKGVITGVEVKRERAWYMSQIAMSKEDGERFRKLTTFDVMSTL